MSELDRPWGNCAGVLDTRGLLCPLPVIRVQDRVKQLTDGTLVDVVATDPGALHDIPAWCRVHGHELVSATRHNREIWLRVRVRRSG